MIKKVKNRARLPKEWARNFEWMIYKRKRCKMLRNRDFTIIASNCVRTMIYYDLNMPFLSPTINLTIGMNDFVKFVENLGWYMEKELVKLKGEYGYPVGMLEDVRINFLHYESFEEAALKWEERKKRINWDNLFFIGTERGDCTYETLRCFDKLPYRNKVVFTHVAYPEISSSYKINGFEGDDQLGKIVEFKEQFIKRRYLDDFDYVNFLNSKTERN